MQNNIEVEGLTRKFKNGPLAVAGIDLHVDPGEIYGFLGPNGAGKSTTVHMLTTLLPPTDGTARVAGHDVVREGPAVRAAIGAALATMPEVERTVIVLAYREGLTQQEIAQRLDWPLGTVKTRTRRALARLRDLLETDGGAMVAAVPVREDFRGPR